MTRKTAALVILLALLAPINLVAQGISASPTMLPTRTMGHAMVSATARGVVINEIMFAPHTPEPEWIELLNTTKDTIDIAGWVLAVHSHAPQIIPAANTLVPPDSLVILSSNDTALAGFRNIPIQRIVRFSLPALSNTGSMLSLKDSEGNLIDSAWYNGKWVKSDGVSIERIDPSRIGYDSSNWSACKDSTGSTILRPNSVRIKDYDLAITNAQTLDTSVVIFVTNVGRDTILQTSFTLQIGTFTPINQPLSIDLPSNNSLADTVPLPQSFYGKLPAVVFLNDSLDVNHVNDTLRCSISKPIPQDSIVINEIMFDPTDTGCEWIELYNPSDKWISMDSIRILSGSTRPNEYSHEIPPLLIAPDSFGIISANDSIYRYSSLTNRDGIVSLEVSSLDLGNESCFLVFHNQDSSTIDTVRYSKSWLGAKDIPGISLERKNARGESTDSNNWHGSIDPSGATPLAPNSVDTSNTTIPPIGTSFTASFSPNPFSPDGDGFEDASLLTIQTGNATIIWELRVRLYDASGRIVRTLTNATQIIGAITLNFDGKRDNGQTLAPGLYTALIELTSQSPLQTLRQITGVAIAGKRK